MCGGLCSVAWSNECENCFDFGFQCEVLDSECQGSNTCGICKSYENFAISYVFTKFSHFFIQNFHFFHEIFAFLYKFSQFSRNFHFFIQIFTFLYKILTFFYKFSLFFRAPVCNDISCLSSEDSQCKFDDFACQVKIL